MLKLSASYKSNVFWQLIVIAIYGVFSYLMLLITLQYIPIRTDVAFLNIKQHYLHLWYYKLAFFTHVFTALFTLLAGFSQFSGWLLKNHKQWHRRLGWFYAITVIALAGPSGFVIGLFANGGFWSQLAFCLLAFLWIMFTIKAVLSALKKEFTTHKKWMWRSFALTLSAITLRAWKYVLVAQFHPKPMEVYQIVAWLGWVGNLIIVESYIIYKFKYAKK
jgi:hypothetical protein